MKALISTNEKCNSGYRVAQVESNQNTFPVAEPFMFWVNCADNVVADKFWFDPADQSIKPIPEPKPPVEA
jgi:hypothetical protein